MYVQKLRATLYMLYRPPWILNSELIANNKYTLFMVDVCSYYTEKRKNSCPVPKYLLNYLQVYENP